MYKVILFLLLAFTPALKEALGKMSDSNDNVKSFLNRISQIESRGGEDMNHKTINEGIHKGTAAIGRYGLMPNTVNEVLNRMRIRGEMTPELENLKSMDHETMKKSLEANPQLEEMIAEQLAGRVLQRQGDDEKAAYSWHQGHNLTPEAVEEKGYKDDGYVKKYNALKKLTEQRGLASEPQIDEEGEE